jgi:iron complex transport system substrate-binding protein
MFLFSRRSAQRVSLLVLATLVLAACSQYAAAPAPPQNSSGAESGAVSYPLSLNTSSGSVTLAHRPARIVSLSPTATEMLFAIGAGSRVVAADSNSDYPPEAPTTKLSAFDPNIEAIASYQPDLVISDSSPGGLARSLTGLGIPVLIQPAAESLSDSYADIEQLGQATGYSQQAHSVVSNMQNRVADIVASVPRPDEPITIYHELDNTYYSATSETFIGRIYKMFGLVNIADTAGLTKNGGYPQLSPEYIISANPDVIVLADTKCCQQSPQTVAARPGWGQIGAVQHGEVIPVDDDIASRWGPRIVDYMALIAARVRQAESAYASSSP